MSRDIAMAENVAALLELEGPDAKAVLWAHNGHARKTAYVTDDKTLVPTMGSRLHELFGREQLVVGFAFNQGSFQAIEQGVGWWTTPLRLPPRAASTSVLAAADIPAFLLDLATAPATGPVADWLASRAAVALDRRRVFGRARSRSILEASRPAPRLRRARIRRDHHGGASQRGGAAVTARPNASRRRRQPTWSSPAPATCRMGWDWIASRRVHAHRLALSEAVALRRAQRTHRACFGAMALGRRQAGADVLVPRPGGASGFALPGPCGPRWRARVTARSSTSRRDQSRRKRGCGQCRRRRWPWSSRRYARRSGARYAAEIAVPDEAHTILIGMALAGNGAAWFGDLKLESA